MDIDAEPVSLDKFVSLRQENEELIIHIDQHWNAETRKIWTVTECLVPADG